ncbi:MAG: hypothetical protein J2P13_09490 [Acidobacteria bacterium]|nr:hypothetical protein [Acidobacteriota bacterium]
MNRNYGDGHDYRYDPEFRGPPANPPQSSGDSGSQTPSSSAQSPAPAENQLALRFADYRPAVWDNGIEQTVNATAYSPLRNPRPQDGRRLRPAVRNVVEALRAMPPAARRRQLSSGRYNGFSPEERKLLRNAAPVVNAE